MKIKSHIAALLVASAFAPSFAHATIIDSSYTSLGGNAWQVDFSVTNDGSPATFAGFTIDFPSATNLALVSAPSTWDSIVNQPDANLPDAGFFDTFVINAANGIALGQTLGGFSVSFTYSAGLTPGALPFVINDANFAPLFFGNTTVTAVPEPETFLLAALGLAAIGLRRVQSKSRNTQTEEVTA